MKKKATLVDVAFAAGVSKMTASRALRGVADVSRENIERVRQAAKEIGYVGNHLATSLSSQQSGLIGVVVPSLSNIVFAEVLAGVADVVDGSGMQPVFGVTDYDEEKEYEVVRNLLSWRPSGLIISGLDQGGHTRLLLEQADIPIMQIMDIDGTPVDGCVGLSHRKAGFAMAEALLAAGRQRIGYVGCALDKDTRAAKRRAGFEEALSAVGKRFVGSVLSENSSSVVLGRELSEQLLRDHPDVDCLYFSNDDMAVGGLFHCLAQGISVPGQLLLAGFNGLDMTRALPVRIATSYTPRRDIGQIAASAIMSATRERRRSAQQLMEIEPQIDMGDLGASSV